MFIFLSRCRFAVVPASLDYSIFNIYWLVFRTLKIDKCWTLIERFFPSIKHTASIFRYLTMRCCFSYFKLLFFFSLSCSIPICLTYANLKVLRSYWHIFIGENIFSSFHNSLRLLRTTAISLKKQQGPFSFTFSHNIWKPLM